MVELATVLAEYGCLETGELGDKSQANVSPTAFGEIPPFGNSLEELQHWIEDARKRIIRGRLFSGKRQYWPMKLENGRAITYRTSLTSLIHKFHERVGNAKFAYDGSTALAGRVS